jgi:predicted DNA-binding transcriptional regulator AlpA
MLEITAQDVEQEIQRLSNRVSKWGRLDPSEIEDLDFVTSEIILSAILPVSRRTLCRKVESGDFPAPVMRSGGRNLWSLRSIAVWRLRLDFPRGAKK